MWGSTLLYPSTSPCISDEYMNREDGPLKVALLNVSHLPAATETNFRRVFSGISGVELIVFDARNLEFPDPATIDAAIITGSIDSVNDDYEYVHAAREWLQTAEVPIFGVCFGHQLVATAFGGEVVHMPERELGYRKIMLDHPEDSLFDGVSTDPTVFLCHEDTVVTPPADATILASNETGIQAMRLGDIVSVQFHPEVDGGHARRLLTELDLPSEARKEALETVTERNAAWALQLRRLFKNFIASLEQSVEAHGPNRRGNSGEHRDKSNPA